MKAVVLSPHAAAKKTPPRSATPTLPAAGDPHPFVTEFFGPSTPAVRKPVAPTKKSVGRAASQAALTAKD